MTRGTRGVLTLTADAIAAVVVHAVIVAGQAVRWAWRRWRCSP